MCVSSRRRVAAGVGYEKSPSALTSISGGSIMLRSITTLLVRALSRVRANRPYVDTEDPLKNDGLQICEFRHGAFVGHCGQALEAAAKSPI